MVNLQKSGDSAVKFVFTDSDHYLYGNGEIEVPVNSLLLVIDESDMVTFKKLSGDPFLSFRADNSNLGTKAAIEQFYKDNMVGSSGGDGSGVTPSEVQTMIDNSLEDYYTDDEVDAALSGKASASDVTAVASDVSTVSGQVATKVAITDFNAYSAATDSRLAEDEEVTAAALNDLQENKADTSAVTQSLSTKQDALEFYSENEIEDSETGETDKYGQIEVADELNGAHVYADYFSTNEEKSPYASIDAWVNDGEGNEKQNRVYADADGVGISADENADDGEGNIVHTTSNVSVSSTEIGMNVGEEGDTSTTLLITSTGVTINNENVATEPYVDDVITGKVDTSAITTSITSGSTDSEIPTAKAVYDAIPTGGGATYSAGRNISIDTANTINCTLPISAGTGEYSLSIGNIRYGVSQVSGNYAVSVNGGGYHPNTARGSNSFAANLDNQALGEGSFVNGQICIANGKFSHAEGAGCTANTYGSHAEGCYVITNNNYEHSQGKYNVSNSGSTASGQTLFSVGNGTANNARHNAFEIRQNGDIYVNDGTNDVRLQDTILALGGLKLVKLSQSEYDNLPTKDPDTLYIITNVVS